MGHIWTDVYKFSLIVSNCFILVRDTLTHLPSHLVYVILAPSLIGMFFGGSKEIGENPHRQRMGKTCTGNCYSI